jgi:hypothetical protein
MALSAHEPQCDFDAVTATLFGQIERLVCAFHQRLGRIVAKRCGNAEARGQLAALGALAALLNDCTIEVEREDITPVSVLAAEQPSGAADTSLPSAALAGSQHPERMVATNGVDICT